MPINSTNTFFWNVYSGGIDHMFLFLTTMYCSKLEWSDADFILHLFLQVTCKVRGIFLDLNPQGFWCLSRNYFQHNFNSSMYWEVWVLITYQGKHADRASTCSKHSSGLCTLCCKSQLERNSEQIHFQAFLAKKWKTEAKIEVLKKNQHIKKIYINAYCCVPKSRFLEAVLLPK